MEPFSEGSPSNARCRPSRRSSLRGPGITERQLRRQIPVPIRRCSSSLNGLQSREGTSNRLPNISPPQSTDGENLTKNAVFFTVRRSSVGRLQSRISSGKSHNAGLLGRRRSPRVEFQPFDEAMTSSGNEAKPLVKFACHNIESAKGSEASKIQALSDRPNFNLTDHTEFFLPEKDTQLEIPLLEKPKFGRISPENDEQATHTMHTKQDREYNLQTQTDGIDVVYSPLSNTQLEPKRSSSSQHGIGRPITASLDYFEDNEESVLQKLVPLKTLSISNNDYARFDTWRFSSPGRGPASIPQYGSSDAWRCSTACVKNVPVIPGIPSAPNSTSFSVPLVLSLLMLFFPLLLPIHQIFYQHVIHETYPIVSGINVSLYIKNCDIRFSPTTSNNRLEVRAWLLDDTYFRRFIIGSNHVKSGSWSVQTFTVNYQPILFAKLQMSSSQQKLFQCTAQFHLDSNFFFGSLLIEMLPGDALRGLDATLPIRATQFVKVKGLHSLIHFEDIYTSKLDLTVGDGELELSLLDQNNMTATDPFPNKVSIVSRTAPITIRSSKPLRLTMTEAIATRSVLRASSIWILGGKQSDPTVKVQGLLYSNDHNLITAELNALAVIINGPKAPLYVTVNTMKGFQREEHLAQDHFLDFAEFRTWEPQHGKKRLKPEDIELIALTTWVGTEQLRATHISENGLKQLDDVWHFVQSDATLPWSLNVRLLGPQSFPIGAWRILSSEAYYRSNIWFILFSWGMLMPRFKTTYISTIGMFCRQNAAGIKDILHHDTYNLADATSLETAKTFSDIQSLPFETATRAASRLLSVTDQFEDYYSVTKLEEKTSSGQYDNLPKFIASQLEIVEKNTTTRSKDVIIFGPNNFTYPPNPLLKALHAELALLYQSVGPYDLFDQKDNKINDPTDNKNSYKQNPERNYTQLKEHKEGTQQSWRKRFLVDDGNDNLQNDNNNNDDNDDDTNDDTVDDISPDLLHFTTYQGASLPFPGLELQRTLPLRLCHSQLLQDAFYAIRESSLKRLGDSHRVVWSNPLDEKLFAVQNGAITSHTINALDDSAAFCLSVIINVSASAIIALWVTVFVVKHAGSYFLQTLKQEQILRATSHRLNHEIGGSVGQDWNILVTRVHYPEHGFVILWTQQRQTTPGRLAIHIRTGAGCYNENENSSVASPPIRHFKHSLCAYFCRYMNKLLNCCKGRGTTDTKRLLCETPNDEDDEEYNTSSRQDDQELNENSDGIYDDVVKDRRGHGGFSREVFLYIPYSHVTSLSLGPQNQREVFIPMKCPSAFTPPDLKSQRYELDPRQAYRIRVLSIGTMGRVVDQSTWSSDVRPEHNLSFRDVPILLLRVICTTKQSSLNLFLKKHTKEVIPFVAPIGLTDIVLLVYGTRASKRFGQHTDMAADNNPNTSIRLRGKKDSSNIERTPCAFTLNAFFGRSAQAAQELRAHSGRIVFSSLEIHAIPKPVIRGINESMGNDRCFELKPQQGSTIYLEKSQISQTAITFEVCETKTGQVVANGMTRFDDMKLSAGLDPEYNHGFFQCFLNHTAGGAPWGRVSGKLDVNVLKDYIRHNPQSTDHVKNEDLFAFEPHIERDLDTKKWKTSEMSLSSFVTGSFDEIEFNTKSAFKNNKTKKYFLNQKQTQMNALDCGPSFIRDFPATGYLQGTTINIHWKWAGCENPPSFIYLHLLDHWSNEYLTSLQWGNPIPNTGTYGWTVDVPFGRSEVSRTVYLTISLEPWSITIGSCEKRGVSPAHSFFILAQSNAFFIVRALPLCELEMAYAAFCRTHGLEMEHMSPAILEKFHYSTSEVTVKVCHNLRPLVPFEDNYIEYVHCAGQCIVSSTSKMVIYKQEETRGDDLIGRRITPPTTKKAYKQSNLDPIEANKRLGVYKCVSRKLKIVENCTIDKNRYNWLYAPENFLISRDIAYHRSWHEFLNQLSISIVQTWVVPKFFQKTVLTRPVQRFFGKIVNVLINIALPTLLSCLILLFQVAASCLMPVLCTLLCIVYEVLLSTLDTSIHSEVSPHYVTDFFFNPTFYFFLRLPSPLPIVAIISLFEILIMFVIVLLGPELRRFDPHLFRYLDVVGKMLSAASLFIFVWVVAMFVLWFILGALISSEAVLPYVVMLASTVVVVYSLWNSYVASRALVNSYIEENLEFLLSIALNNFFESSNLTYNDDENGVTSLEDNDSKLSAFRDRIKEELKERRFLARRSFQLQHLEELEHLSVASGQSNSGYIFSAWARKNREKICVLLFEKVVPTGSNKFYFDESLHPKGFDVKKEKLSVGARLASVNEVEIHQRRVEDLLKGSDVAMLRDGVKFGPRFGYMLSREPLPNRDFNCAIAALPRYPRAEDVPTDLKLQMIFDNFNIVGDDYWDEKEFEAFATALKKKLFIGHQWVDLCGKLSLEYNINVDPQNGLHRSDLTRIYDKADVLDLDFQTLFPPIPDEEDDYLDDYESFSGAEDEEGNGYDFQGDEFGFEESLECTEEFSDDSSAEDDREQAMINFAEDDEEAPEPEEEEYIRKVLESSPNARKLQFVFNTFTQHYRSRIVDDMIGDVTYVASKILEANSTLLIPIFGQETVLGLASPTTAARRNSTIKPFEKRSNPAMVDALTSVLRTLHVDLEQEMMKLFRLTFQQIFDHNSIRTGIIDFCGNVWPQKIQTKANQLLNAQLGVTLSSLHITNQRDMQHFPLKTSHQVMNFVRQYQVASRDELHDILLLCDRVKGSDIAIQVGVVTKILLKAGVLTHADIIQDFVTLQAPYNKTRRVIVEKPRSPDCYTLIASVIERQLGSQRQKASPEQIINVIRSIVTEYLWFDAFKMLTGLLGIDLFEDEFPGSAVAESDLYEADPNLLEWLEAETQAVLSAYGPTGLSRDGSRLYQTVCAFEDIDQNESHVKQHDTRRRSLDGGGEKTFAIIAQQTSPRACIGSTYPDIMITPDKIDRLRGNLIRMKRVFDQLSNGSCFLASDLADEAMLLLSDTQIHICTVIACLHHLGIGGTSLVAAQSSTSSSLNMTALCGSTVGVNYSKYYSEKGAASTAEVLELLGAGPQGNILEVGPPILRDHDYFDWTAFRNDTGLRSGNLAAEFKKCGCDICGFMGKSELVEFVKNLQRSYLRHDEGGVLNDSKEGKTLSTKPITRDYSGTSSSIEPTQRSTHASDASPNTPDELTGGPRDSLSLAAIRLRNSIDNYSEHQQSFITSADEEQHKTDAGSPNAIARRLWIGFEIFHRVLFRLGLSVGLNQSRILWALACTMITPNQRFQQFLPAEEVSHTIVMLYLQPVDQSGKLITIRCSTDLDNIHKYKGYLMLSMFKRFLKLIGVQVSDKGMRAMWDDFQKDPLEISEFLPKELSRENRLYFMRIDTDRLGLDPTLGRFTKIDTIKKHLPKLLITGLSTESLKLLLQILFQLNVNDAWLDDLYESLSRRTNRYGLIRPEDLGKILSNLSVEGMSFPMLRDLIIKMRLDFPAKDVKRMFDTMDLNNDKTLSLLELLGGFEVLLGRFLPEYICEAVGVTVGKQLMIIFLAVFGLATFFAFLCLAFSSFTGMRSGMSTIVQSFLALAGAAGLQSHASQDLENVRRNMRRRIEQLFGDTKSERFAVDQRKMSKERAAKLQSHSATTNTTASHNTNTVLDTIEDIGRPVKLKYIIPKKFHPEIDDPKPCVTFYTGTYVRMEPQVLGRALRLRWFISPRLNSKFGLTLDEITGVISGEIPNCHLRMPRRTFDITCRNSNGSARARITFQILPRLLSSMRGSLRSLHADDDDDGSSFGVNEGGYNRRSSLPGCLPTVDTFATSSHQVSRQLHSKTSMVPLPDSQHYQLHNKGSNIFTAVSPKSGSKDATKK